MSATAEIDTKTNLVRPLRVIRNLIKEQIDAAKAAAEDAAEPFCRKAGPLFLEAREGHFVGNTAGFFKWCETEFGITQAYTKRCLAYSGSGGHTTFKTLHKFKYTPKSEGGLGHNIPRSRPWTQPVDEIAERARKEAFRLAQEESLSRAEEREAERKLASRLIDIGYKVLAKELHPDKMHGDKEAMQRLVRVRDKLKHCI